MYIRVMTFLTLFLFFVISVSELFIAFFLKFLSEELKAQIGIYGLIAPFILISSSLAVIQIVGIVGMCTHSTKICQIYTETFIILMIFNWVAAGAYILQWNGARIQITMMLVNPALDLTLNEFASNEYINYYQKENKCCGITSYENWKRGHYPPSCCKNVPPVCRTPFETPCAPFFPTAVVWLDATLIGGLGAVLFMSPMVIICMMYSREKPIEDRVILD
ncbi:hypothetical protein RF11_08794 [Thelohanellus kitauei]|uniref:Tetraspanin n=1 Tax=Thelohanellus kitauei TaxID=669202 RepID=A0A0C2NL40_THEKT|nr:hypothetical protein RF11_08794 [Thelohanellus kitauei]